MERPTLEAVLRALDTLYSGDQTIKQEQRAQADVWLTQLSRSVSKGLVMVIIYLCATVGVCLGDI